MERRTLFPGWLLPTLLVLPQLAVTAVFFLWPAGEALLSSVTQQDAFGISTQFVGLANFAALFADPLYLAAVWRTAVFCALVGGLATGVGLLLAVFADRELRGRGLYRVMLVWPYAVAPPLAAVLWVLLLNPQVGWVGRELDQAMQRVLSVRWDYALNGWQAMALVVLASAWKQVSYDFIFLLAGLQAIPRSVIEAARLDGARGWRRLRTMTVPLLLPTFGFLAVVNLVYAAFDTFGTIDAITHGGPGQATETLVVKVYRDGIVNLDAGSSSAQSVVLMAGVVVLTALQFRVLRRRDA